MDKCWFESSLGYMSVRKMVVYYEGLSDEEEEALSAAIESIICPGNSDESPEHECRLHAILWSNVENDVQVGKGPIHK